MSNCCTVALHVAEQDGASLSVTSGGAASLTVGAEVYSSSVYHGAYAVTPSQSEQVLYTADKLLRENVVVAPIPSNYGLITYNGSTITVS